MESKEEIRKQYLAHLRNVYESSNYQQGGAVVTRHQAKNSDTVGTVPLSNHPVITSKKRKLEDVVSVSNKKSKEAHTATSPVPGPSSSLEENPLPPQNTEDDLETEEGNENEPFDTVTTIYEDNNLQVNVVKEMFKRQKIFRIEDHSYVMRIKLKNKKSEYPMLDSLMDVLYQAFTFMINNLKTFIPRNGDEDNLIYLCIYQDGMINSINSKSYWLQSMDTETLVQEVLSMFDNYVNSDSTINVLDNSFKCYFRVLSVPHVQYSKHKRKTIPQPERIPSRLGCRLNRRFLISNKSGLFDIPGKKINNFYYVYFYTLLKTNLFLFFSDGYPENENCFLNKCLLTSFIFGFYQSEKYDLSILDSEKKDSQNLTTYDRLLKLNDKAKYGKIQQNIAGRELNQILTDLCQKLAIPFEGPHNYEQVLGHLALHYKCQIHLITGTQERSADYESFPEAYDDSLPQIFLFKICNNHVVHIQDLKKFFRSNRLICFYCHEAFSARHIHKCSKSSCSQCSMTLATSATKQFSHLPFQYCNKNIVENNSFKCNVCQQITFKTQVCLKNHSAQCVRKKNPENQKYSKLGQACQKCFKFISFRNRPAGKTPEDMVQSHKCLPPNYRVCKYCREQFPTIQNHSCKVRKKELTTIWPNLVFFNFECRNLSSLNCDVCKTVKLNYLKEHNLSDLELHQDENFPTLCCKSHQGFLKEFSPNVAVIWRESKRGVFEEHVLVDRRFQNKDEHNYDIFRFEYFTSKNVQPYVSKTVGRFNQRPIITKCFQDQLDTKLEDKKMTIIYKFIKLITQPEWQNSTLISWNDKFSHLSLIFEAFSNLGATPTLLNKSRKIFLVSLENQGLRFIDACNFFSGQLHDVALQFEVEFEKNFFPDSLNRSSEYQRASFPALNDFLSISDNLNIQQDKKLFWEKNHLKIWNFETEIINHSRHRTKLLAKSCLTFLKQTFCLQERIKNIEKIDSPLILHPFSKGITSRSSFTFNVHKVFYLNKYELETVMFEKTSNMKKVSLGEYQFCCYKFLTEPDNEWIHALNSSSGQKKFGNYHVDLYSEKLNTVYQFQGCLYHAHEPCKAKVNKNRTPTTKNFLGRTFAEQQVLDKKFVDFMSENYPSVKLEFINACDWEKKKRKIEKNNKTMWNNFKQKYKEDYDDNRPLKRLIPREAIRGGALDVYNLTFDKNVNTNEDIYFCDINSLYSDVAMNTQFGIGPCKVLSHPKELEKVFWNFTIYQFCYEGIELQGGAAFCKVLVPQNEEYPFLPFRINNEYTVMACCRTCAEKKLTKNCTHKDPARSFTGCWMISTLNQLAKEGYQIKFYEIHYFPQKAFLLRDYVQILCSERLKNSGIVNNSMDDEKKQLVCDEINKVMNLSEQVKLNPKDCVNNPGQKQCFKDYMNCLFGFFSRNTKDVMTKKCYSQNDIDQIALKNKIVNVNVLTDKICSIDYVLDTNKIPPNLDSNIYIGGEVSSAAFVQLRKHLKSVINHKGIPLMIDTDAIIFKMPKGEPIPLKIGPAVGLWKHEYQPGKIEKFFALASRNYAICYSNQNDILNEVLKVRGLSLKLSLNQKLINCDVFKNFILNFFQNNFKAIKVPQTKRFKDSKTFQYCYKMSSFNFANNLISKRFLLTSNVEENYKKSLLEENADLFKSYPYGYKLK